MNPPVKPILLVVAAPAEGAAAVRAFPGAGVAPDWSVGRLSERFRLLVTGIGKVNAGGATARALQTGAYEAVISLGIAGALPGSGLGIGQPILASASVFADEGIQTPAGFQTCAQMGFPLGPFEGNAVQGAPALLAALAPLVHDGRVGMVATVSTCSGTDELARRVVERTGALAEAMEGAAVGQVVARFSDLFPRRATPFVEARVISNTTGDRGRQQWDVKKALAGLTDLCGRLGGAGAVLGS